MGRSIKVIADSGGVDRRAVGHYPTPEPLARYLVDEMVRIHPTGESALDPCVGTGTLLTPFAEMGKTTRGIDIGDWLTAPIDTFSREDFLSAYRDARAVGDGGTLSLHDYFVLNPPYNCHESDYIRQNRSWLIDCFADVGQANMYTLFISAVIELARPGALIGVVTLDSLLTARLHEPLRRKILDNCRIHRLILCPTDLFLADRADVRTCILVLEKGSCARAPVRVLNRTPDSTTFFAALRGDALESVDLADIVLSDARDRSEFTAGVPPQVRALFDGPRLGEAHQCVTGISTGRDSVYLSRTRSSSHSVSFIKNPASRRFWTEPDAYLVTDFMQVAEMVPNFMVRNRATLGAPGITCSSMGVTFGACYRPEGTVFGVNPNIICDDSETWWLLGFLNGRLATYLIRGILLRTNMVTSGYVSRMPLPELSTATMSTLSRLSKTAYQERLVGCSMETIRDEIDATVFSSLRLSDATIETVVDFNRDLRRLI